MKTQKKSFVEFQKELSSLEQDYKKSRRSAEKFTSRLKNSGTPVVPLKFLTDIVNLYNERNTKLEKLFQLYQEAVSGDVKRTIQSGTFTMFNESAGERSKRRQAENYSRFKKLVNKGVLNINESYQFNLQRLSGTLDLKTFISSKTFYNYKNLLKSELAKK